MRSAGAVILGLIVLLIVAKNPEIILNLANGIARIVEAFGSLG